MLIKDLNTFLFSTLGKDKEIKRPWSSSITTCTTESNAESSTTIIKFKLRISREFSFAFTYKA